MANTKITELVAITSPASSDVLPIVDVSAGITKKVAVGEVVGIINGDVDVAADGTATISELPVSKLQDGSPRQLLQTDAAGTGVEWTSNVDLPGTASATSFSPTGSSVPANGFYLPTTNTVALSTNGTGRLFVDANGNVGVNAATPNSYGAGYNILTLNGSTSPVLDLNVAGTRTATFYSFSTNTLFGTQTATPLQLITNGTEKLRITSAGLVGIGTSLPPSLLSVHSTSTDAVFYAGEYQSAASPAGVSNTYVKFEKGDGFGGAVGGFIEQGVGSGLKLAVLNSGTLTDVITIRNTGNVGIGTTSPSVPLTVQADSNAFANDLIGRAADNGSIIRFKTSDNAVALGSIGQYGTTMSINSIGAGPIAFYTNNTERARIDSSGRLLVGTSSNFTNALLQVNGNASIGAANALDCGLEIGTGATGNRSAYVDFIGDTTYGDFGLRIIRENTGANTASVFYHRGTGVLAFNALESSPITFTHNIAERARIDSSGRLLVGTSSASGGALLQINGNRIRVATAKTPASATDTGTAGEICWDASYVYVCTATNTWKRAALSTW